MGGGGYQLGAVVTQDVALYESYPLSNAAGVTTGWSVRAIQGDPGGQAWNLRAFVVCGPLP